MNASVWAIAAAAAQETKPVPKDSLRVSIPGCTKGYVFTVGRRTADEPGSTNVPEGMHLNVARARATLFAFSTMLRQMCRALTRP